MSIDALRDFVLNGGWYGRLRMLLDNTAFVRSLPLFAERISMHTQQVIATAAQSARFSAGEVIPPDDGLYVVKSGQVHLDTLDGRRLAHSNA